MHVLQVRLRLRGEHVSLLNLAQDFSLADNHGVKAGCDGEQVPGRFDVGLGVDVLRCRTEGGVIRVSEEDLSAGDRTLVRVALDARMQQVYHCDFRLQAGRIVALAPERVCAPEELSDTPGEAFIAAGNGFERFEKLEKQSGHAVQSFPQLLPRASMTARLAMDWLQENEPLPAALAQPVYIRNEVAVKPTRD